MVVPFAWRQSSHHHHPTINANVVTVIWWKYFHSFARTNHDLNREKEEICRLQVCRIIVLTFIILGRCDGRSATYEDRKIYFAA